MIWSDRPCSVALQARPFWPSLMRLRPSLPRFGYGRRRNMMKWKEQLNGRMTRTSRVSCYYTPLAAIILWQLWGSGTLSSPGCP